RQRQGSGIGAERVVDKYAADIVLFIQGFQDGRDQLSVFAWDVDQVGATVGGHDRLRLFRILADHAVAGARRRVLADAGIVVVGVKQRKMERLGDVDGQKAARQEARYHVGVARLGCWAGSAFLGNGGEAVISNNHDVRGGSEAQVVQSLAQAPEIVVGVSDGGA